MKIDVLTLFPEMFSGVFNGSILKRAQDRGAVTLNTVNFRDFSQNKHKKVDDYPYGGGAGMLLAPQPIFDVSSGRAFYSSESRRIIKRGASDFYLWSL